MRAPGLALFLLAVAAAAATAVHAVSPAFVGGAVGRFRVTHDTYLQDGTSSNKNDIKHLWVGGPTFKEVTLLRFDNLNLTGVDSSNIHSARLVMRVSSHKSTAAQGFEGASPSVARVTVPWDPTTVSGTGNPDLLAGGSGHTNVTTFSNTHHLSDEAVPVEADVTEAVRHWADHAGSNHGLALVGRSTDSVAFVSRERCRACGAHLVVSLAVPGAVHCANTSAWRGLRFIEDSATVRRDEDTLYLTQEEPASVRVAALDFDMFGSATDRPRVPHGAHVTDARIRLKQKNSSSNNKSLVLHASYLAFNSQSTWETIPNHELLASSRNFAHSAPLAQFVKPDGWMTATALAQDMVEEATRRSAGTASALLRTGLNDNSDRSVQIDGSVRDLDICYNTRINTTRYPVGVDPIYVDPEFRCQRLYTDPYACGVPHNGAGQAVRLVKGVAFASVEFPDTNRLIVSGAKVLRATLRTYWSKTNAQLSNPVVVALSSHRPGSVPNTEDKHVDYIVLQGSRHGYHGDFDVTGLVGIYGIKFYLEVFDSDDGLILELGGSDRNRHAELIVHAQDCSSTSVVDNPCLPCARAEPYQLPFGELINSTVSCQSWTDACTWSCPSDDTYGKAHFVKVPLQCAAGENVNGAAYGCLAKSTSLRAWPVAPGRLDLAWGTLPMTRDEWWEVTIEETATGAVVFSESVTRVSVGLSTRDVIIDISAVLTGVPRSLTAKVQHRLPVEPEVEATLREAASVTGLLSKVFTA